MTTTINEDAHIQRQPGGICGILELPGHAEKGKASWFLPFDKGYNDGAGNPPNPDGLMTDYLWKNILTKLKLSRIIENYAQVNGIHHRMTVPLQAYQLMGQPCDRI